MMGRLFEQIWDLENLCQAWERVQRQGSRGGIDGVSVSTFASKADKHLQELSENLQTGHYSPEPTERVHAPKFNAAGEFRPLSLPAVKDKIVQQAVRTVIEPLFERRFLDCSYAYRPKKGARKALSRVNHYLKHEKRTWAIFGDLDNFFDSLNHDKLLAEVQKVIFEPEILSLIGMWLKIGTIDQRGRYHDLELGIAQGGIISPLLSNIYAHPLDEFMTSRPDGYVRYADNFIALCHDRPQAQSCLTAIETFIQETLQVRLNPEKEPIRSLETGFVFLGVAFQGQQRRLAPEKLQKIRRKLDWLTAKNRPQPVAKILAELVEMNEGVRRYYSFLEPWPQLQSLDDHLVRRLGILLQQRLQRREFTTRSELRTLLEKLVFLATPETCRPETRRDQVVQHTFATPPAAAPASPSKPKAPAPRLQEPKPAVDEAPWHQDTTASSVPEPPLPSAPQAPRQADASLPPASNSAPESAPIGSAPTGAEILKTASRQTERKKHQYVKSLHEDAHLLIQTPGTSVGYRNQRVVLFQQRQKIYDRPLIKIKGIMVNSPGVNLSSNLIEACTQADIPIIFSNSLGRHYAMLLPALQAKTDLGLLQIQALENGQALQCAKQFILGKIKNQLNVLKYFLRSRGADDSQYAQNLAEREGKIQEIQEKIKALTPTRPYEEARNQLFALEGQAAVYYWQQVRLLLPDVVQFTGRVRQGAQDVVNATLNYGYGMLYPRIERALLLAGLNLHTSFLHSPQAGKPTLSYDLIEIFRPPIVDRTVFSLFNRGRKLALTTNGRLSAATVQLVVEAILERLGTLVLYRRKKITLEQVIHQQASLLAHSLREKVKFRPFLCSY